MPISRMDAYGRSDVDAAEKEADVDDVMPQMRRTKVPTLVVRLVRVVRIRSSEKEYKR